MEVMDQCTQCGCVLLRTQEGLCASCLLQAGLGDSGVFRLDFEKLLVEAADRSDTAPNRAESMLPTREVASEAVENLESAAQQAIDQSNPDQTRTFGGVATGNDGLENPTTELNPDELSLDFLTPSEKPDCLGTLGIYEITEVIGRGGFGIVLKGFDPNLNRAAAIKILSPELASDPTARKRFLREARSAAAVSHPNVVEIYEIDNDAVLPYLVMEFVDGATLDQRIKQQGPLSVEEILRIGTQTAAGLAAAHAQGLIHRDIKPANILVPAKGDCTKITDFGLARTAEDAHLTRTGTLAGTPQYMSPEQADGIDLDSRCDLFSLGGVLYAMSTGKPPFRGENTVSVLQAVCDEEPPSIAKLNRNAPKWLAEIIAKLQAKNPDDRFQSADEVAKLLEEHLAHMQNPNENARPKRVRVAKSGKTRRSLVAAAVLLVLFGGLALTEATGITNVVNFVATVLRIRTPDGTLVVKVDDPNIKIEVTKDGTVVINGAGPQELRLQPGRYQVKASGGGRTKTQWITIERGGRRILEVRFESAVAAKQPSGAPPLAIAPFDADQAKKHQQTWANYLGVPVEKEIVLGKDKDGKDIKLTMVLIPPGEFQMGSSDVERARFLNEIIPAKLAKESGFIQSEGPRHPVRITKPFWLSRHEITYGQFRRFVEQTGFKTEAERDGKGGFGRLPSGAWVRAAKYFWNNLGVENPTDEDPVVNVSWNDARAFCNWLTQSSGGVTFALPTEAQWEFSCRAGTAAAWHAGDVPGALRDYAWFLTNSGYHPRPVGRLRPNSFGLYDMHGGVFEWCSDWYAADYYASSPTSDPLGPVLGSHRVCRSGSWDRSAWHCRSASRNPIEPSNRFSSVGFRLAAVLPQDVIQAAPLAIAPFGPDQAEKHQEAWAKHLGRPVETTNSIGMKLRLIPPGQFEMRPKYDVTISKAFQIGTYEVTIAQFRQFVEETGYKTSAEIKSNGQHIWRPQGKMERHAEFTWRHKDVNHGDNYPVAQLSWNDAVKFCEWLSKKEGKRYRLPTEAEWEWACRCGSLNNYHFGDNATILDDYVWYIDNCTKQTHPVGLKKPNPWGLFDTHGNVCEYCLDWHAQNFPSGQAKDPHGPAKGQFRVIRGGGYIDTAYALTLGYRGAFSPSGSLNHFGIRVVCEVDEPGPPLAQAPVAGKEGWVELFNGKDLTGWKTHPKQPGNWRVEDGILIGDGPPLSHLFTKRGDYRNFHVYLEMKVNYRGDSGLYFRSEDGIGKRSKGTDLYYPMGYEAQIMRFRNRTGELVSLKMSPVPTPAADEWIVFEVIAIDNHLTTKVNGRVAADYHDKTERYREGHLALQTGGTGWTTKLQVRTMLIKEIALPAAMSDASIERISNLPAAEQVEAVFQELKRRNPAFDGAGWKPTIENGVVTELVFCTDHVTDISPVRALTQLRRLEVNGTPGSKGLLADLSSLKGMKLKHLAVGDNQVADLAPLRGMPLERLYLRGYRGSDLTPLEGMPLTWLHLGYGRNGAIDISPLAELPLTGLCLRGRAVHDLTPLKNLQLKVLLCRDSQVSDLTPLRGMPLRKLEINRTKVTDLTSLKGMPLEELWCDFEPSRDAFILREIKTLKTINDRPADEFWKDVEKRGTK